MARIIDGNGPTYESNQSGAASAAVVPDRSSNAYTRFMRGVTEANQPLPGYNFANPNPTPFLKPVTDWLQSDFPLTQKAGFEVRNGEVVARQDPAAIPSDVSPTRGPDRPGYYQQAVYGDMGQIIGYRYVSFTQQVRPGIAQAEATDGNLPNRSFAQRRAMNESQISEGRVRSLLSTQDQRIFEAAVQAWTNGVAPDPIYDVDAEGKQIIIGYDWEGAVARSGRYYLGVTPGYVAAPAVPEPDREGLTQEEQLEYEKALRQQVKPPLYQEKSVDNEFRSLGREGVWEFQKLLVKAGAYGDDEPVIKGNIGLVEIEKMRELMARANYNGTDYMTQLQLLIGAAEQRRREQAAAAGGGGGGGGGNSTYTQVNYSVTSMAEARALLTSVLRNALGRFPTDDEVAEFVAVLNAAERKAPITTVTRTTSSGGATRSVVQNTPSTVDPTALAEEFASDIEGGAEEYQYKADNYIAAFLQSLGG